MAPFVFHFLAASVAFEDAASVRLENMGIHAPFLKVLLFAIFALIGFLLRIGKWNFKLCLK